jgi:fructokinase
MRIGIDLGGTKIEGIALDNRGRELKRFRVPTPKGEYEGTIAAIAGIVSDLEKSTQRVGSVGVGIPGTVMRATGKVKNANSTWLNGREFEKDLSAAMGRQVICANDANCFAISEATDGAGVGYDVVFGVILGTGCGGGVVMNGKVGAGPNGLRGEWGHTPLPWPTADEYPGPSCYCGKQGCVETWISGTGFEMDFARVTGKSMRGPEIVAAAEAGDLAADAALLRYEDRLARSLAVLVDVLDPDVIVLGGGMSRVRRLYEGGVATRLRQLGFGGGVETPIVENKHGDSSGVRGAAWLWSSENQE